jgi:hypothetical protein
MASIYQAITRSDCNPPAALTSTQMSALEM